MPKWTMTTYMDVEETQKSSMKIKFNSKTKKWNVAEMLAKYGKYGTL